MRQDGAGPLLPVILVLGILLAGCAGASDAARAAAQIAERPTWAPSDSWTYRGRGRSGEYVVKRTVLRAGAFEGWPGYEVQAGDFRYWYTKDLGYIARLRGDRMEQRASPPEDWRWPLMVGRSWSSTVTWVETGEQEERRSVTAIWLVEAYEDVKTPAGTFKTFKAVRREFESGAVYEFWYSPAVKAWVKLRGTRAPDDAYEEELTAYEVR